MSYSTYAGIGLPAQQPIYVRTGWKFDVLLTAQPDYGSGVMCFPIPAIVSMTSTTRILRKEAMEDLQWTKNIIRNLRSHVAERTEKAQGIKLESIATSIRIEAINEAAKELGMEKE